MAGISTKKMKKYAVDGLCVAEIAALHEVDAQTVKRSAKYAGVRLARRRSKVDSFDRRERLAQLMSAGYSQQEANRIISAYDPTESKVSRSKILRYRKSVNIKKTVAFLVSSKAVLVRPWKGDAFGALA